MSITWVSSPNYTKGREGQKVSGIVIHWMAGTLASTDQVFKDTTRKTSAHYGIEDSTVHQYVSEADTAYHAGTWAKNLTTVGIEHSAQPGRDASEATYQTSARLIAEICKRHNLAVNANTIVPHRSIVATQCPGTLDLAKLISLAQTISQGDTMSYADINILRIVHSELEGWPREATHKGEYDGQFTKAYGTQTETNSLILEKWAKNEGYRQQLEADKALAAQCRAEDWPGQIASLKKQLAEQGTELKPGKYIVK